MARTAPPIATSVRTALEREETHGGGLDRFHLEQLVADVAAEILLLEVERRRIEAALLSALGPRISRPDPQSLLDRREELDDHLAELRELACEVRARLRAHG